MLSNTACLSIPQTVPYASRRGKRLHELSTAASTSYWPSGHTSRHQSRARLRVSAGPDPSQAGSDASKRSPVQKSGPPALPVSPGSPAAFNNLENMLATTFNAAQPDLRGDWLQVEGCWVLAPPQSAGPPQVVAHFLGGAFVGAAPQLTYRLLLEALAARGVLVIATPFAVSFDHMRIADEAQFRLGQCLQALDPSVRELPLYGVGHSMGALLHLLISSRYAVSRAGNVFMSFNNKPATDAIPFLAPFIGPGAQFLRPLLMQLETSPLRSTVESITDVVRGMSPGLMRQVLPLIDQLLPVYQGLANGRSQFHPHPRETSQLVQSYYGVQRNLLMRFADDQIDETGKLASILTTCGSGVSRSVDMTVRTLPGEHIRPLRQTMTDLPPEVAQFAGQAASQGNEFFRGLSQMATQAGFSQASTSIDDFAKGVSGFVSGLAPATNSVDDIAPLADEIAVWMGVTGVALRTPAALPSSRLY